MVRSLYQLVTLSRLLVAVLATLGFSTSFAQEGDAQAGKQKSAVCAGCHGQNGISATPQYPHLAGQVPSYIAGQLAKFKSGDRENAMMAPFAAQLSEQDMADLDAYFVSLDANEGAISEDQKEAAMAGGQIYRGGYAPYSIAACMSCHGPSGHGIPPSYPRVSGQVSEYLEAQLLAFKSGTRSDPIMNPIAFALSEEQIKQLALYMSAIK